MNSDLKFLNAFNCIPGVGPATLRTLKKHFATFEEAWRASESILATLQLQPQAYRSLIWKRPSLSPDKEMERLVKTKVWMMPEDDPNYPSHLKEIPNPPLALYVRGKLPPVQAQSTILAVVGTRRPTSYGLEATESIVHELASLGIVIASGLATGIDTRAHTATLDAGGKTIAVLGSGVDHNSIFPPENRGLARRIEEAEGAVLSEYAPATPAVKEHFPQRNRIISGLAQSTVVIEARERSGALITARFALEQNRDVYALPGSIFSPHTVGPHKLIQEGAKLITCAKDILEELGIDYTKKSEQHTQESLDTNEQMILHLLEEPLGTDFIQKQTRLDTATIVASLSMLELKGLIKNMGGDTYQKI